MKLRRQAMQAKLSTMFVAGVFAAACAAAILLPAGCESTNQVAAARPTEVCPVCGQETRTQPLTGLKYTTCICPKCGQVSTLDKDTAMTIERAYGYEPAFMVTVCEGCAMAVKECATCREARG
jgi:hypothetical protein